MGEPSKKQAEQAVKRTDKGQFARGQSGNPSGRPKGAANKAMQLLRSWTLSTGLPQLIAQAESGDRDALRLLVSLGLPKVKPQAAPIDGIQDLPRPRGREDLARTCAAIFEHVVRGNLSLEEAEKLLGLAEQLTGNIYQSTLARNSALKGPEEDPFAFLDSVEFPDVHMDVTGPIDAPVDTVKIRVKKSFKEQ